MSDQTTSRDDDDHTGRADTRPADTGPADNTGPTGGTDADRTQRIEQVDATAALPTTPATAPGERAEPAAFWDPTGGRDQGTAPDQPAHAAYPPQEERPPAPGGPHLPAIVLGLLALAVAGLAIADTTLDLSIDWNVTGPIGIVVVGGVLVLLGVLGLAGNRRRG